MAPNVAAAPYFDDPDESRTSVPDIFWLPLTLSLFATAYFWLATDMRRKWKVLAAALTVAALLFTFVPALQFHFLVPLALQVGVSIWVLIYRQLGG